MHSLLRNTKYALLAVLSCSLAIALYSSNPKATAWITPYANVVSQPEKVGNLWDNIRPQFKMDHHAQSAAVRAEIRVLLADQDNLNKILKAAGPYLYYIVKQTQDRRLPAELALIPFIESEFNPNDHSNKGATGLWQLMPETARILGVKVRSGYDGRRNVVSSTKAALVYFRDLGTYFKGNWYLAIAAYNCGQGKVDSAIRRTGTRSFWNLEHLPHETRVYVPKLLAVAEIVKNPQKYGVKLPPITNKPYFTQVDLKKSMNLTQVAKSSGISMQTLKALNPDYKHAIVPIKGTYSLLVPVSKLSAVKATVG